jgi:hypothetical protein
MMSPYTRTHTVVLRALRNSSTVLQAGRFAHSKPSEVILLFNWRNSSSRTMALGPTQPVTEMSTRVLLGGNQHKLLLLREF